MKRAEKVAARLEIHGDAAMTPDRLNKMAKWLRLHARAMVRKDPGGVRRHAGLSTFTLYLNVLVVALAAACAGATCYAQDPAASPAPAVAPSPDAVRFSFGTYTAIALGRPDTKVRFWLAGDVQGPLIVGSKAVGDLGGSASVETLPAKQDSPAGDITDLSQWGNVVSLSGWAGKRIGDATFNAQSISTSIVAEGDIATALFDAAADPLRKRFYRGFGIGVQFTLHLPDRDAYARIAWGKDEAVGPFGKGHLRLSGELPIPALKGARLKIKAGLGLGALSQSGDQTDYFVIAVGKPW